MKEEAGKLPVYSMGVAERLTGLTARQIRYWEANALLSPSRTQGHQRLYSQADIERLKEIKRLLGEGMTLQRIKTYLANRDARRRQGELADERAEAAARLTSLYPLTNRAELMRILDRNK